jgi:hypothetical protein
MVWYGMVNADDDCISCGAWYALLADELSRFGYATHSFDYQGFGDSDGPRAHIQVGAVILTHLHCSQHCYH